MLARRDSELLPQLARGKQCNRAGFGGGIEGKDGDHGITISAKRHIQPDFAGSRNHTALAATGPIAYRAVMKTTAIVLAGGQGRRFGGADKGLADWRGRPMVATVIERLAPQVDEIIISCNRNLERYRAFGYHCVADAVAGYPGPLAGIAAGARAANNPVVLLAPCDYPLLPDDLARRLAHQLADERADISYAVDGEHKHYLVAMLRRDVALDAEAALTEGIRAVRDFYRRHRCIAVDFRDEAAALANINSPGESDSH